MTRDLTLSDGFHFGLGFCLAVVVFAIACVLTLLLLGRMGLEMSKSEPGPRERPAAYAPRYR